MNTDKKFFKVLKKGDILLIIAVIIIILVWFIAPFSGDKDALRLVIYLDGKAVETAKLSSLTEGKTFYVGGCEIFADSSGVRFVSSCCEDGLCVKRGTMKRAGDTMACVPERVVVSLYGDSNTHIDAY